MKECITFFTGEHDGIILWCMAEASKKERGAIVVSGPEKAIEKIEEEKPKLVRLEGGQAGDCIHLIVWYCCTHGIPVEIALENIRAGYDNNGPRGNHSQRARDIIFGLDKNPLPPELWTNLTITSGSEVLPIKSIVQTP